MPPASGRTAVTRVALRIGGLGRAARVQVQMPVWSPGDYSVQNHARYVRGLTVTGGRGPVPVTRPDANTWQAETGGSETVTVRYEVPNTPPGNFSENVAVRDRWAFYNGPAVFAYVVGHKANPATLEVRPPGGWRGVTSPLDPLPREAEMPANAERFSAPDYDTLADCPVLVGDAVVRTFEVEAKRHAVAFYGDHEGTQYDEYLPTIRRIVDTQARMMGGLPYRRYVFFFEMGGRGGGLEHGNSCRIAWHAMGGPDLFAMFVAHEFQHLWNVKRIRPRELGPFDYVRPPRTPDLWFCEGVTQYTAVMSLRRAGVWTDERLMGSLAGSITALQRTPGRLRTTAEESGLGVWDTSGSDGSGGLSYYLKGEMIGLCLDLRLRAVTGGRASLDDVLRDLLRRHAPPLPGYGPNGLRDAMVRAGGPMMGDYYDLLCRSTREMPFEEAVKPLGLRLTVRGGYYQLEPDASAPEAAVLLRRAWLNGAAPAERPIEQGVPGT